MTVMERGTASSLNELSDEVQKTEEEED